MVVVHAASAPIPSPTAPSPRLAAGEQCAEAETNSKGDQRSRDHRARAGCDVNDRGIVLRDEHDLRIRRLNHINRLPRRLLCGHGLLRIAAQRACCVGLTAQTLNGICDSCLVRREGIPDRGIVVDVLRHHLENLREIYECDECRIETLLLRRIREGRSSQVWICRQPIVNVEDLLRVGRSRHDLRQQRVWIKRDGRQQLIQLLWRKRCGLCGQQWLESLQHYQDNY